MGEVGQTSNGPYAGETDRRLRIPLRGAPPWRGLALAAASTPAGHPSRSRHVPLASTEEAAQVVESRSCTLHGAMLCAAPCCARGHF